MDPNLELVAIREKQVPLRAIRPERGPVIDVLPEALHIYDVFANGRRCPGLFLQIVRCREVVRMGMGVEYPFNDEFLLRDIGEDRIGIPGRRRARLLIEVEHGIDDGAFAGVRIRGNILDA